MRHSPIVSIILPTYNRAGIIESAIDSVIKQTYSNWELIIWDDGSTDNTHQVVESYKDGRIRYYWEENHGVAYARNRAVDISQGQYLAFLDSDDQWLLNKLAQQVKILKKYDFIKVMFSNYKNTTLDEDQSSVFEIYKKVMSMLDVRALEKDTFLISNGFLKALITDNFIATDTAIMKRTLFDAVGGFNEELKFGEDFELWCRIGLNNYQFGYTTKVLLHRNKLKDGLSSASLSTYENRFRVLDSCAKELVRHDRRDLLPFIKLRYRNTWQNMIRLYGNEGNKRAAVRSFIMSLQYGISFGSLRLLLNALISNKMN